jgi:hypothetical protein
MLTENQRKLIAERKGGKDKEGRGEWKTGDYALRQALKSRLDSIEDILEILDVLPDKQIQNIITPKQMINFLKVLEKLLALCPPIEVKTDENGNMRAVRYFQVDMASRLRGLNNAVTGAHVSYPATEDETEFWDEFRYMYLFVFKNIMEYIEHDPKAYTRKEFNNIMKPLIESRKDVKVTSGEWVIGDPKEDVRDVDPLIDAERKVLSMKSKKLMRDKKGNEKPK